MEWKLYAEEKPELGKVCVVINSAGEYQIRKYEQGYIEKGDRLQRLTGCEYEKDMEVIEAFRSFDMYCDGGSGRVVKEPVFYIALPEVPELTGDQKTAAEIGKLKARVSVLESKLKSKKVGKYDPKYNKKERVYVYLD